MDYSYGDGGSSARNRNMSRAAETELVSITATIMRISFRNEENGWTVAKASIDDNFKAEPNAHYWQLSNDSGRPKVRTFWNMVSTPALRQTV